MLMETFSSGYEVCCQEEVKRNLLTDKAFNELYVATLYGDLSGFVRARANLFQSLSEDQTSMLQKGLGNADLIVVASKVNSKTVSKLNGAGNITISGSITVFDLRTGEFVAFVSDKINRNSGNFVLVSRICAPINTGSDRKKPCSALNFFN